MVNNSKFQTALQERGLLKTATAERLPEKLCIYVGFDPTADSLHIGSLIQLQILRIAKLYGHKTIAVIGSGTTLIGDPTWKNTTRPMLDKQDINRNAIKIRQQIERIAQPDLLLDNIDWLDMNLLKFLREIGSHFSVNQLINLETFAKRLENNQHLSFLELSYPLLQAYDFLHLHQKYGCNVQLGGSDQWGNIVQGVNYINKISEEEVYGLTNNLLLSSSGEKMGKTTSGAIFLDPELTKPYDFWQFWRNVGDDNVQDFLIQLTELSIVEIKDLLSSLTEAKKTLADKITSLIHGEEVTKEVRNLSEAIFEKGQYNLLPYSFVNYNTSLDKVLFELKINESISEAKRMIQNGAVQVDGIRITDPNFKLTTDGHILCYGKQKYFRLKEQK